MVVLIKSPSINLSTVLIQVLSNRQDLLFQDEKTKVKVTRFPVELVCGAQVVGTQASVVAASRLSTVAHGLSCSTARGILPNQELNPCPLHWQADS